MTEAEQKLNQCYEEIRDRIPFTPAVAVVLGSGLGAFAEEMDKEAKIPYKEIPGMPVSTIAGHTGRFVFGHIGEVPVVCMQGRVHYYEGYSMEEVVLPIRLMRKMGAKILYLTNSAGALNKVFRPGNIMMITDQISSFVPSPLLGPNPDGIGARFPDMSHIYDLNLQANMREAARRVGIQLREGVYLQTTGPQYESPAEVRMYREMGGSAVGMSTAVEAIAAVHCGFRVCGLSLITNAASGMSTAALSHEAVTRMADEAAPIMKELLVRSIKTLEIEVSE